MSLLQNGNQLELGIHIKIFILSHGAISKFVEDAINEINLPDLITFGVIEQIKPFPLDKFYEQVKKVT